MHLKTGFLDTDRIHLAPTAPGALDGLRFAVKDLFDVAGTVTGLGNPLWRQTHAPAQSNAACIDRLLAAGAELVGKTLTDEFAYSLTGQNTHYGTPPNPAVADGIPGGSSSGSASVVAAGLVDFALGTDTGGSMRIPASYCGIYGLRTSHSAIATSGLAHLAKSFDVIGWFARRPDIMLAVGRELLPKKNTSTLRKLRMVKEVQQMAGPDLAKQAEKLSVSLGLECGPAASVGPLEDYLAVFRTVQAFEAWALYGAWITQHQPPLGPGVRERFAAAAQVTCDQMSLAKTQGAILAERVCQLVGTDTVLCMPTAPNSAFPLDASPATIEAQRSKTLSMTSIASVAGLPQLSLPWLRDARGPVGFSLIGPRGSDLQLLKLSAAI